MPSNSEKNPPERIYYSISNEDEANTVSFVDLDTRKPKVQSNGGQGDLITVSDSDEAITLLNHPAGSQAAELYTIFRRSGVVICSQQQDATLIGPFGVLEMSYRN